MCTSCTSCTSSCTCSWIQSFPVGRFSAGTSPARHRMARDGPGWRMLRGCDAPRPLVPGRLYDICPRTEIFCTKKTYTKTYQLPRALKPNSCCGTNNFLTKKKNIRIRKILFKIDARAPKIWYGPQREMTLWPSRFLFGEGFRFSILSMPWFQGMQPGRAAQELIARVVHSLALVSADVSLQEALRSQGQRKLQFL